VNKDLQPKTKQRTTSDFNTHSLCPSTAGTKSGTDIPTTSVKESTTAQNFGEDLSGIDGFNSRKHASVRNNCQSHSESNSQPAEFARAQNLVDCKAAQTPEPPAAKVIATEDDRMQRAEAKMNQALHLSEIQSSFTQIEDGNSLQKQETARLNHDQSNVTGQIDAPSQVDCPVDQILENETLLKTHAAEAEKNLAAATHNTLTEERPAATRIKLGEAQAMRKM